ncbi:hypothetical protein ACLB2K_026787 [Fragaria x ananassa]
MFRKYIADPSHVLQKQPISLQKDLTYEEESVQILDRKEQVVRNKTIPLVKVLWRSRQVEEAIWELEGQIRQHTAVSGHPWRRDDRRSLPLLLSLLAQPVDHASKPDQRRSKLSNTTVFVGFRQAQMTTIGFPVGLFLELRQDYRASVSLETVGWSSVAPWRDLRAKVMVWDWSRSSSSQSGTPVELQNSSSEENPARVKSLRGGYGQILTSRQNPANYSGRSPKSGEGSDEAAYQTESREGLKYVSLDVEARRRKLSGN